MGPRRGAPDSHRAVVTQPGSLTWARAEHARGRTVSCGLGIHPGYAPLSQLLPRELVSSGWRSYASVPEAARPAAPWWVASLQRWYKSH